MTPEILECKFWKKRVLSLLLFNKCNLKSKLTLQCPKLVHNVKMAISRYERLKKFNHFFEVSSPFPRAWSNTEWTQNLWSRFDELNVQPTFCWFSYAMIMIKNASRVNQCFSCILLLPRSLAVLSGFISLLDISFRQIVQTSVHRRDDYL